MKLIILIIFLSIILITGDIIYERIPKYNVGYFILDYFDKMGLYDCFKKQINEHEINFKCLKNNELINIILKIDADVWI